MTIIDASDGIDKGKLSVAELVEATLKQIEELNPEFNAFNCVMADEARASSKQIESGKFKGSPLCGIPIGIKDLFDIRGIPTTAGSELLKDNIPQKDSFVVEKLRSAGAIFTGKNLMDAWALGTTTENPFQGTAKNPHDPKRVAGGSSGGSALAVATGMSIAAIGTDTGGSIRVPASFCGIVGLKPTHGRVSMSGAVPLSHSMDHAGPLTKAVKDAAILLQQIAGFDPGDPASQNIPIDDYLSQIDEPVDDLRILVPENHFFNDLGDEIESKVKDAIDKFSKFDAKIEKVDLGNIEEILKAGTTILLSEAYEFHKERMANSPEAFSEDQIRKLEYGKSRKEADIARARDVRASWRKKLSEVLKGIAIIATPTTSVTAPRIGEMDSIRSAKLLLKMTQPFSFAGVPAISVPCGFDRKGLPIGLQLIAAPWREKLLLQVANNFEKAFRFEGVL